jgi:hypothetical protein
MYLWAAKHRGSISPTICRNMRNTHRLARGLSIYPSLKVGGFRVEAGQEIADRLEQGRASFETAAFATSSG